MEEFERRVTLAHQAKTTQELSDLTADLAPSTTAAAAPAVVELAPDAPAAGEAIAIFGGVKRHGPWKVPRRLRVVALFGGVQLDLREARLPAGIVEIDITATFGGVQILVPPTLAVEVHGRAIFGGFEHLHRAPDQLDPSSPLVRIRGRALFGGVQVATRLPGENRLEAHLRRRHQRRIERHPPRRIE